MTDFLLQIDYSLLTLINSTLSFTYGDLFFVWVTDLHKTTYFKLLVIPLLLFFFIKKYKREGVTFFIFLILALSFSDFTGAQIKHLIERSRPENNSEITVVKRSDAGNYSFYSNHASNMFAFASYTSEFFPQIKVPLYLLASAVAYSRVYNGVHYPSDVFAGSFIGLFWGFLFSKIIRSFLARIKARKLNA